MKQIPLSGKRGAGKFAIVDDDLLPFLSLYSWCIDTQGYARAKIYWQNKSLWISMHQFILPPKNRKEVDHINGDKLDNRTCNLRLVSRQQNSWNITKVKAKSGYKGVWQFKKYNRWRAYISVNHEKKYLGSFIDVKDAARAYNSAAIKYFGEHAYLNKV